MALPKLLVLGGPTASGKTALAVALAQTLRGEIVSCDSMQVYRGMDIGSAKPGEGERGGVAHHMLDVADPREPYSVGMFREQARAAIADILSRGRLPVLCGGTGLYIDAVTRPMSLMDSAALPELRARLTEEAGTPEGARRLHDQLAREDPETAARLHVNDVRRVVRALEVLAATGIPPSRHARLDAARAPEFDVALFGIDWPRDALYARVDRRVDEMMRAGLLAEVRALLDAGVPREGTAMQGLGYKQLAAHLAGACMLPQAVEEIKLRTRNYAKRQLTWFRRDARMRWLPASEMPALKDGALRALRERWG